MAPSTDPDEVFQFEDRTAMQDDEGGAGDGISKESLESGMCSFRTLQNTGDRRLRLKA